VDLVSVSDAPVIRLGENTHLHLECEGCNRLERKGIQVPRTASLYIGGKGDLAIKADSKDCFGIGNDIRHSHGNIWIALDGHLAVHVNGDSCVGIGGGKNRDHQRIRITCGTLDVFCSGSSCVGIGVYEGSACIEISDVELHTRLNAPNAVSVGAMRGVADVRISSYYIDLNASGTNQMGIGVLEQGTGHVCLDEGKLYITLKGIALSCVGTRDGRVDCDVSSSKMVFYCEGGAISGVGDLLGAGDVRLKECDTDMTFLTSEGIGLGSPGGVLEVVRCNRNIKINE
jgi:hypothetical protein